MTDPIKRSTGGFGTYGDGMIIAQPKIVSAGTAYRRMVSIDDIPAHEILVSVNGPKPKLAMMIVARSLTVCRTPSVWKIMLNNIRNLAGRHGQ